MPSEINFTAVLIANIIGIAILFSIVLNHSLAGSKHSRDNKLLKLVFIVCFISCIVDPLCCFAENKQGILYSIIILLGNTWLYCANLITVILFHMLVTNHLRVKNHIVHKIVLLVIVATLGVLLIVNFFTPIVFSIYNNTYKRTNLFWVVLAVELLICLDGIIIYIRVRLTSKRLKFFPVFSFVIPALIGILIQSVFYGVSTIFPFYAVSFGCVTTSLQNDKYFRDRLTGLFNRSYFNTLEKKLKKSTSKNNVALMLDINNFKQINDVYGHNEGDKALINVSNILLDVVNENGIVIRYAGDEFIIILYQTENNDVDKTINAIHSELAKFNSISKNPYDLSVSIGHCKVNLQDHSMNELVDKIDKLMYVDKRKFYDENKIQDRRKVK